MDTLYIAMTGANAILQRQTVTANNMANVNTTGFRADQAEFRALPVFGQGLPTRVYTATQEVSSDFRQGPIVRTGRPLDVAVKGPGWLAVQGPDGKEAYTRDGNLQISGQGILMTATGHPVIGNGGAPISLPSLQSVTIGADGTVSGVPMGSQPNAVVVFNRIKLVNPPESALQKGADGLFTDSKGPAPAAGSLTLDVGALEGSNVNPVSTMIQMLEDTRQFETQTKLMQTISQDQQASNQLLILP